MRILHLVDRLDARGARERDAILALAERHEAVIASGTPSATTMPCEVRRIDGLRAASTVAVRPELDAIAAAFEPHAVFLHSGVNADALGWVASRGGFVAISELRAFHPERAIGREGTGAGGGTRPLCAGCFDNDPFFRGLREDARRRVDALRGARAILAADEADAAELATLGLSAPIVVVPFDPTTRADWLVSQVEARHSR